MANTDVRSLRGALANGRARKRGWSLYPRFSFKREPIMLPQEPVGETLRSVISNPGMRPAAERSNPASPQDVTNRVPPDESFLIPIEDPPVRRTQRQASLALDPAERRTLPRKAALMSGVLIDVSGENAADCMILDVNARGAQISFSKRLPTGGQIYLLDTCNRAAYLASVVWTNRDRAGLSFLRGYNVSRALPPPLKFFWRLLLESKFREVDRLVAGGLSVGLAFSSVGLAEEHIHHIELDARADKNFERLLLHARRLLKR